ncbi:hypothetical protein CVS40_4830 [Lucilia cuprina]|nr:hypothetical protein CVS40_4830 [Lucilia cuprina]
MLFPVVSNCLPTENQASKTKAESEPHQKRQQQQKTPLHQLEKRQPNIHHPHKASRHPPPQSRQLPYQQSHQHPHQQSHQHPHQQQQPKPQPATGSQSKDFVRGDPVLSRGTMRLTLFKKAFKA